MKIAHIIFSFLTGGAETMLIDILNRQAVDHDITLIIVNNRYDYALLQKINRNVNKVFLNRPEGSKNPLYILRLNWILIKNRFDTIHLHSYKLPAAIFPFVAHGKLVYTVHDVNIQILKPERITRLIAISDSVYSDISKRYSLPVSTIPNGIDFESIDVLNKSHCNTNSFRIVQVARLDHNKKGQDILLNAIALLKKRGLDIVLDLIGEGPSMDYLQSLANELNISANVNFLGLRDRKYVYEHLCDYDMMCHPARFEGFGLTVAEGMAAGIPVLVSDSGGPAEIVADGKYGYTFINGSINDCARMIEDIINNYDAAKQLALLGRENVRNRYSIDSMVDKYLKLYSSK